MKPLPAAPLTDEDEEIWHEHVLTERLDPYYEGMHLWQHSQAADRRDAELMWRAQRDLTWLVAALVPGEWIYVRSMGRAFANFRAIQTGADVT